MVKGAGSETMETRDHRPLTLDPGAWAWPWAWPWARPVTLVCGLDPGLRPGCLGLTHNPGLDPGRLGSTMGEWFDPWPGCLGLALVCGLDPGLDHGLVIWPWVNGLTRAHDPIETIAMERPETNDPIDPVIQKPGWPCDQWPWAKTRDHGDPRPKTLDPRP